MKKIFLTTIVLLMSLVFSFAQTKTEQMSKKWKITAYETFGVKEDLKEEQKKDYLQFNADKTFVGIENGKEVSGKWNIEKTNTYLTTTNTATKEVRNYKLYSVTDKDAVIEYKDPDLIKTKYYLTVQ